MNPAMSAAATVLVVVVGCTTLRLGTDQWSAWTAESARRLDVLESPRELPDLALVDNSGQQIPLRTETPRLQIIDFIYTQCPTVCLAMGAEFRLLQAEISVAGWADQVRLLSLTFDLANDDAPALSNYLDRFSADRTNWQAARVADPQTLQPLLDQLGVVVIPEPTLGFVHNAAIYLVDEGRVVEIFDVGERKQVMEALRWRLDS